MGYVSKLLSSNVSSQSSPINKITIEKMGVETKGEPIFKRYSTNKVNRVPRDEIERVYAFDSLAFTGVNMQVQMIMSAGYDIVEEGEEYEEFFKQIGKVGEELTDVELFNYIFKFKFIYGNAYVEKVYNTSGDRIVDLALIDPKKIDYAKDHDGNVVLNEMGKPVGYIISVPRGKEASKSDDMGVYKKVIDTSRGGIFISADKIAHFKLYTFGDRFNGMGVIEPCYTSTMYKMNISKARTNFIYQRANSPIVANVGDENHEPTPEDIENVLDNLSNLKTDRYLANPYWVDIKSINVSEGADTNEAINDLVENQTASLGMPRAFITGSGEATNRATLARQQKFLEDALMGHVRKTVDTFKREILDDIKEVNGYKEDAHIEWGDIGTENVNDKSRRIKEYVAGGILKPEEVRRYVINTENLDIPIEMPESPEPEETDERDDEDKEEDEDKDDKDEEKQ